MKNRNLYEVTNAQIKKAPANELSEKEGGNIGAKPPNITNLLNSCFLIRLDLNSNIKKRMQDLVNIAIEDLLKKKYIARTASTWNIMIRPVLKPDKSIRICLNLMALNEITESDKHRLPNIDDILDIIQGN